MMACEVDVPAVSSGLVDGICLPLSNHFDSTETSPPSYWPGRKQLLLIAKARARRRHRCVEGSLRGSVSELATKSASKQRHAISDANNYVNIAACQLQKCRRLGR